MDDGSTDAETLLGLGTATLGECGARRLTAPPMPMWRGAALAGRACPVQCSGGDNLAIHVAVAHAAPGDVLVVDVGGVRAFGYWGEVLTAGAQARGVAGLVIDGCIRDLDALERRRFPAFARGTALPGATKTRSGRIGRPLSWGGVEIALVPGSSPIATGWWFCPRPRPTRSWTPRASPRAQ